MDQQTTTETEKSQVVDGLDFDYGLIGRFFIDGPIFGPTDLEIIERRGFTGWAVGQSANMNWEDAPLDWNDLPMTMRSVIVTDALEPLQLSIRYAVPFRHLGRVITFAILPDDSERPEMIRVRRQQPQRQPATQERVFRDPPVPFLSLGVAGPEATARHARMVRQFFFERNPVKFHQQLKSVLVELATDAQATRAEVFYYALTMRAMASGSWRQLRENFGLMAVEHLIAESVNTNPMQAQALATAHLVDGVPIDWGEENPLNVTLQGSRG